MEDTLVKLLESMVTMEPVLVTVTAEEVENKVTRFPALSTDVKLAFLVSESQLPLPKFLYKKYVLKLFYYKILKLEIQE